MNRSLPSLSLAIGTHLLAACATPGPASSTPDTLSKLVADLSANGPGCAVSARSRGKLIAEFADGYASPAHSRRLAAGDAFDIGSVSKSFTAAVVMDLARNGVVNLDAPVATYVDNLPSWGEQVTVGDMLYMRSGIPDFIEAGPDAAGWQGDRLAGTGITLDQYASFETIITSIASFDQLHFTPGSEYEYSNSNYMLLRYVAEKAAGRNFQDLLREIALDRAGINVRISDFEQGKRLSESQVQGFDLINVSVASPFLGDWDVLGASSLWVSVHDLALWGEGILSDPTWFDLVSSPGISQTADGDSEVSGYAAGLMTRKIDGELFVYHLGGTEGFSSGVFMRPEKSEVLAFSCNMSPELTAYSGIAGGAAPMFMSYEHLVFLYAWLGHDGAEQIELSSPHAD